MKNLFIFTPLTKTIADCVKNVLLFKMYVYVLLIYFTVTGNFSSHNKIVSGSFD